VSGISFSSQQQQQQQQHWHQQYLLQEAVRENYERLDAEMSALLEEWEQVRRAYERVHRSTAGSDFDATQSGEWEVLQDASNGLLQALDGMLNNTYTRLPQRLSLLRGKVSGFTLALAGARRRRRAMIAAAAAPVQPSAKAIIQQHMLGAGTGAR
jgi:uncharacterized membrane-anchored protein